MPKRSMIAMTMTATKVTMATATTTTVTARDDGDNNGSHYDKRTIATMMTGKMMTATKAIATTGKLRTTSVTTITLT